MERCKLVCVLPQVELCCPQFHPQTCFYWVSAVTCKQTNCNVDDFYCICCYPRGITSKIGCNFQYVIAVSMGFYKPIMMLMFLIPGVLFIYFTKLFGRNSRGWNVFMWSMLIIGKQDYAICNDLRAWLPSGIICESMAYTLLQSKARTKDFFGHIDQYVQRFVINYWLEN